MPKFKKNKSAFMMKGYAYPGISPLKKDVKEIKGTSIFGIEIADMKKSMIDMVRNTNKGVLKAFKAGKTAGEKVNK